MYTNYYVDAAVCNRNYFVEAAVSNRNYCVDADVRNKTILHVYYLCNELG